MVNSDIRRENARALAALVKSPAEFGRQTNMSDSQISQLIGEKHTKNIGNLIARRIEKAFNKPEGWLDLRHDEVTLTEPGTVNAPQEPYKVTPRRRPVVAHDPDDSDYIEIRKVRLKLSAGISGYAVDPIEEDGLPITFRRDWFDKNGYVPEDLIAIKVRGDSMEPALYAGDTVVINTADKAPRDGFVFAVNYEGEDVVKRLLRDNGEWWLLSDNPDQRRFPRKLCRGAECMLLGRIVHKQSEHI